MEDYKICNYKEERIDFTATVKVPVGFIITSLKNYSIELILDKSNLHETKKVDSGLPHAAKEMSHFNLHGSIEYNVVVREFRPAKLLQADGVTAFTANDTIVVDMNWGYKYYENLFPEYKADHFTLCVIKHTEFVVDEMGQKIPFCRRDPCPFYEALRYADSTQIICIPYTLILRPLIPVRL